VELAAKTEDEFIAGAKDADALLARGRPFTRKIIQGSRTARSLA